MNIGITYFAGNGYGLGHHYRCIALAEEFEKHNHTVYIFSNFQYRHKLYFQLRPHEQFDIYHILDQCNLDWLIIDTPYKPDEYIFNYRNQYGFKILYLNADKDYDNIDLNVIQGCLPGAHSGPQWVILRPSIDECRNTQKHGSYVVFGGSEDKMDLMLNVTQAIDDPAILVGTPLSGLPKQEFIRPNHFATIVKDDPTFLNLISSSHKAIMAMGMSVWEAVYYGIGVYVFSPTEDHLRWAQAMEKEGLIKAYPDVGIPDGHQIKEFVSDPFEIAENQLDLKAVERIVGLVENE